MDCLPCLVFGGCLRSLTGTAGVAGARALEPIHRATHRPSIQVSWTGRLARAPLPRSCYVCLDSKAVICEYGLRCVVCTLPGGSCEHTPDWVKFAFESKLEDPVCRCHGRWLDIALNASRPDCSWCLVDKREMEWVLRSCRLFIWLRWRSNIGG